MKKSLDQIEGTIANYLMSHKDEIWSCGNDVKKMKKVVLKLLQSKQLESNPHTSEAIKRFNNTSDVAFPGMLTTYLLGTKANF